MQIKFLYNLIEELAGEGTGAIAEILFNKKDVNEFKIATKMGLTINKVRNILYKLSNYGLVSFIRKKDNKKGWYIYYWTLDSEKCLVLIEGSLIKKIDVFRQQLESRELERYYICKSCGIEVTEEQALEHGFSCEECAEIYELVDNTGHIRDIKGKITKVSKELDLIRTELEQINLKKKRKKAREEKKVKKEAEAKKELMKKLRANARKKIVKSKEKKKVQNKKPSESKTKKKTKKVKKKILKKIVKKSKKKK